MKILLVEANGTKLSIQLHLPFMRFFHALGSFHGLYLTHFCSRDDSLNGRHFFFSRLQVSIQQLSVFVANDHLHLQKEGEILA